jgi:thioredoxin:protein disulfide reductase
MQVSKSKSVLFRILITGWIMLALLLSANSFAFVTSKSPPLPADQAFAFSAVFNRPNEVLIEWQIAPGYYLYAKRVHIAIEPKTTADIRLPQGELNYDQDRGKYEAYSGNISIPVLLKTKEQQLQLSVDYQGCSQGGFCYPPMHKTLTLNLVAQTVSQKSDISAPPTHSSLQSLVKDQNGVQALLQTQHLSVSFLLFIGLGLLLAATPCVWPMVPILTGIIIGQKQVVGTRKAFFLSLTYVLGMSITYAIAGLMAASMGHSLQVWLQTPMMIAITTTLFVLLALSLFGFYDLRVRGQWQNKMTFWSNQQQRGTYAGVFFMGMLSTLIVSPCVTAPLVGVLMYIAATGNLIFGASALFAMGIGMGIPLLLIGMSVGKWLPTSGPWMEAVKKTFGILMLAMAIWLFSRIVPPLITSLLWGAWIVGIALFLSFYLPRVISHPKLNRSLGFLVGCSGMLLMIGGIGSTDKMSEWMHINGATVAAARSFIVVHDIAALEKQLSVAQGAHQPVILDFYADWCESCVAMDRNVFNVPDIQKVLTNYVLLRADLSKNSTDDQALLKRFDIIAPPTVLFFDQKGHEMNSQRIVGEINAEEFLTRLNIFTTSSCDKNMKC